MTSSDMCNEIEQGPREDLPSFLHEPDKIDKILYVPLMLVVVHGFVIILFHVVLLFKYTFLHMWLTGSNLSVLILASENEDRPLFPLTIVVIAVLSIIKFMPFFYWMGKEWGPEFITMGSGGHPPRWSRKMESSIYERIGLSTLASFMPFSPIPVTIVMAVGGIAKARGWVVGVCLFLYATMLKRLYLYLGLTFGPSIQGSLQTTDRYVTYIAFVLIGWMPLSIWRENKKSSGQVA